MDHKFRGGNVLDANLSGDDGEGGPHQRIQKDLGGGSKASRGNITTKLKWEAQ
jgi:hypothetical protein